MKKNVDRNVVDRAHTLQTKWNKVKDHVKKSENKHHDLVKSIMQGKFKIKTNENKKIINFLDIENIKIIKFLDIDLEVAYLHEWIVDKDEALEQLKIYRVSKWSISKKGEKHNTR
jgi:hypothetical protein